jgi:hypothetical protein
LKTAGAWAVKTANEIGTKLAEKVIEGAIGIK